MERTLGENGLPKRAARNPKFILTAGLFWITFTLGVAIAYFGVYKRGPIEKYNQKIEKLVQDDMHWACAAIVVFARIIVFVNAYPFAHKARVVLPRSGNLRANPFYYKQIGKDASPNIVALIEDGSIGAYNRANRSLHHMIENYGALLAGLTLGAQVFPFPVFVIVCAFGFGRIIHQIGYTIGFGYHAPGFYIATLATATLEGLHFIIAMKGFGYL
ncbi:hypothetical protein THRCLA_20258 [Thraustotheca clavata]|uniref:MAPEG family protein n=1 Tax=Thraustotheca clavata TaxID=74557 RepID=A0A1W0A9C4_9STRA|nr:hypothetical protein THRCLA_20258 [Thraustotheca clavata]